MSDWASAYAGRRALVLGASGFIGRWVVRALTDRGASVTAVARDRSALESALGVTRTRVTAVLRDLTQPLAREWLPSLQPDIVFNLAGYGVDRAERDEGLARRLNHELVAELSAAVSALGASDWPHARLVHAGSALEYGTTPGLLREDSPTAATTLYGRSKLAGTMALVEGARATGTRAIVGRLFTVYGPGEHAGRLLPSILDAAARGSDLPLSDGEQRRDFAYVEDVVEGLLRLAVSPVEPGTVVNVATGVMQRVRDFAEVAGDVCGIPRERLRFGTLERLPEEMRHRGVSVDLLQKLTGWRPPADIAMGVRRALERLNPRR